MKTLQLEQLSSGIAIVTLDRPESKTNLIDQSFTDDLTQAVIELESLPNLKGVIFESAKNTFVAGGDLKLLAQVTDENADQVIHLLDSLKALLRRLETLGKPVVSCIAGSALGGGLELALASHYRIAVDRPQVTIGLPEVTLGLLPAAGGVSRVTRLLGLEKAIPFLTQGRAHSVSDAKQLGLIDELVAHADECRSAAERWINANPDPRAPWDVKGFKLPGGLPNSAKIAQMLSMAPAMILKETHGCYPAATAILSAAVEGAGVAMDAAGRIETRYFMTLAKGAVAKNLIKTLFFAKNDIESRAKASPDAQGFKTVGVVGAGMMGAGIAWACALKGLQVVLLDTSLDKANKGKAYSESLVAKRIERGHLNTDAGQTLLERITPSDDYASLAPCDLIIEAVFEDRDLKTEVYAKILAVVSNETVLASNTSTLPIRSLAESVAVPEQFIGLHFFSPVDKMPLLEIIRGSQTSQETVDRALAFAGQINKTPIVVNDGRGFFTSRVFKMFTYEGMAMLAEGIPAAAIENAAWLAGYPVGPLAVSDEVTLTLMERIRRQTQQDLKTAGEDYVAHPGDRVIDQMLELNRASKASGAGFYHYPEQGKKHLWPGLVDEFGGNSAFDVETLKDRFLYIQALESLRAMNEGVVTSEQEANVGSILGFGYPAWTGGVVQFVHQTGQQTFIERCEQLAEDLGERFSVEGLL